MQVADQEEPVLNKLAELERKIGELAVPCTETTIVRAFGPKGEVFYAVQGFRHQTSTLDYYAIRLRKLGHIRYIGNRERPMYVSPVVLSERYDVHENSVYAIANTARKTVAIGPKNDGGIADPEDRGMGLGCYALSLMIRWLKYHYPDYRVTKTSLAEMEADEEEQERRDKCLSRVGLSLAHTGHNGKGYFYANSVLELREHINTRKIEEIGIDGLFSTFSIMQEWHKDLTNEFEALKKAHGNAQSNVQRFRRRGYLLGALSLVFGLAIGAAGMYVWFLQMNT